MKLTYFKLYARAEGIRMLLDHSKTEFEDKLIEFGEQKQDASLPNGQVPVLEMEGKVLNQSVPILRLLGNLKGYYN